MFVILRNMQYIMHAMSGNESEPQNKNQPYNIVMVCIPLCNCDIIQNIHNITNITKTQTPRSQMSTNILNSVRKKSMIKIIDKKPYISMKNKYTICFDIQQMLEEDKKKLTNISNITKPLCQKITKTYTNNTYNIPNNRFNNYQPHFHTIFKKCHKPEEESEEAMIDNYNKKF